LHCLDGAVAQVLHDGDPVAQLVAVTASHAHAGQCQFCLECRQHLAEFVMDLAGDVLALLLYDRGVVGDEIAQGRLGIAYAGDIANDAQHAHNGALLR